MKTRFLVILLLAINLCSSCAPPYAGMDEKEMLESVRELEDPFDRMEGFRLFLARYPASTELQKVRYELFKSAVAAGSEPAAISSARDYLDSVSDNRKVVETVEAVVTLARRGLALDTGLIWLDSMELRASTMHRFYQASCLDARALIHFRKNSPARALTFQQAAVDKYGDEVEFVRHLAEYEHATGHAKRAIARVLPMALEGDRESLDLLLGWTSAAAGGSSAGAFRDSLVFDAIQRSVDTAATERQMLVRSTAAVFLARTGVQIARADAWSDEAFRSLTEDTPVEENVHLTRNRAAVLAALGRTQEALSLFDSIRLLMDPWQTLEWMTYASLLEKENQFSRASEAYATALLASSDDKLQAAYEKSYVRFAGSRKGLFRFVSDLRDSLSRFSPPHRTAPATSAKTVLGELFTGADCGPCVSADLAFDALAEYYGRQELIILEYHLHIPRPDPLTTNDGWERYLYYGGDFGTPVAFFDGRDKVGGGGPKFVLANRFAMYQKAVSNRLTDISGLSLSISALRRGSIVQANVEIKGANDVIRQNGATLHIALVENSVNYTGSNGINPHAFVVRKLADGSKGFVIQPGSNFIQRQINLDVVDKDIQDMIDRPESLPSKSPSMTKKPIWRSVPPPMNRENLSIVAWIQIPATKEIPQAAYVYLR